ncbi:hypothetical protein EON64_14960 [archaeon]|nr:MAG: hypothetical protein EON64_14960 [archaeon]
MVYRGMLDMQLRQAESQGAEKNALERIQHKVWCTTYIYMMCMFWIRHFLRYLVQTLLKSSANIFFATTPNHTPPPFPP